MVVPIFNLVPDCCFFYYFIFVYFWDCCLTMYGGTWVQVVGGRRGNATAHRRWTGDRGRRGGHWVDRAPPPPERRWVNPPRLTLPVPPVGPPGAPPRSYAQVVRGSGPAPRPRGRYPPPLLNNPPPPPRPPRPVREVQRAPPELARLSRELLRIIKLVHHSHMVASDDQPPRAIANMRDNLASFINPACPNEVTSQLLEGNARNWEYTTMIILRDHYKAQLEAALGELRGEDGGIWTEAFDLASRWARRKFKHLESHILDNARAHCQVFFETIVPPPPPPPPPPPVLLPPPPVVGASSSPPPLPPPALAAARPVMTADAATDTTFDDRGQGVIYRTEDPAGSPSTGSLSAPAGALSPVLQLVPSKAPLQQPSALLPSLLLLPPLPRREPQKRPTVSTLLPPPSLVVQGSSCFEQGLSPVRTLSFAQSTPKVTPFVPQGQPLSLPPVSPDLPPPGPDGEALEAAEEGRFTGGGSGSGPGSPAPASPLTELLTLWEEQGSCLHPLETPMSELCPQMGHQHSATGSRQESVVIEMELGSDLYSVHRNLTTTNKSVDWKLTVVKPILFIGDSNLSRFPPFSNSDIQVESFPGANFFHAQCLIDSCTVSIDQVDVVVMSFGINCKNQRPSVAMQNLDAALRAAMKKFPRADIRIPMLNYSSRLSTLERQLLERMNQHIEEGIPTIPPLPKFSTCPDLVHWDGATAKRMWTHWLSELNF